MLAGEPPLYRLTGGGGPQKNEQYGTLLDAIDAEPSPAPRPVEETVCLT